MSWAEVKKAINSDLNKPLNEKLDGIEDLIMFSYETVKIYAAPGGTVYAKRQSRVIEAEADSFGVCLLRLAHGVWSIEIEGGGEHEVDVVYQKEPIIIKDETMLTLNSATWEEIETIAAADRIEEFFEIGDIKEAAFDSGTIRELVLVGIRHDDLTSGGKANYSFMTKKVIQNAQMNSTNTNTTGWSASAMRLVTMSSIYNSLPEDLKGRIKPVNKKASAGGQSPTIVTVEDNIWIASPMEIFGEPLNSYAGEGEHYPAFPDADSRKKSAAYWTRASSNANAAYFVYVDTNGSARYNGASYSYGVVPGFCI